MLGFYEGFNPTQAPTNAYGSTGTTTFNGLNRLGQVEKNSFSQNNGSIDGLPYTQYLAISEPWKIAKGHSSPFYAAFKDPSLTDPNVFDFYNNLLDGDTRRSWRFFHTTSMALDQTFLNNRVGFSAAYDKQNYGDGQNALLTERNQAVNVDVNATLPSYNQNNPNAGRAMITSGGGSGGGMTSERVEKRVTAFGEFRFTDIMSKGLLTQILGKHIFTGMVSQNSYDKQNRGWQRFMVNPADVDFVKDKNTSIGSLGYQPIIYISPDLRDTAKYPSASSLHLSAPSFIAPKTVSVGYFDSNWKYTLDPTKAGYVNPADLWVNPFSQDPAKPTTTGQSTQSENPANYVGWTTKSVRLLDADNGNDREQMITSLSQSLMKISTKAFVWQGFFFNGNLVPTFGYRADRAKSYVYNAGLTSSPARMANGLIIPTSPAIAYPTTPSTMPIDVRNRSWSIVAHSPQFIRKNLPWGSSISLTYNTSSNFNPNDAARSDLFGRSMAPSSGKTRDIGVLVSALENKINFRVVKFKTENKNVNANPSAPIGAMMQLESRGWVMAKKLEAGLAGREGSSYNFGDNVNGVFVQTPEDRVRQVAVVNAVLSNVPTELYKAWNIDTTSNRWESSWDLGTQPAGCTSIQDRMAEGWEYEINLKPTPNWSITANMAKISAKTDNNFSDIKDFVMARDKVWNGIAGDVGYSNGLPSAAKNRDSWNANVMSLFASGLVVNGEKVQELVPTRFNLVSNYNFKRGFLKGVSLGGAYRWEDKTAIGYVYKYLPMFGKIMEVKDLTKPIYGKQLTGVDAWVGYERKVTKDINWRCQLNLRDVGAKNTLVPIGANPDGSVAVYRIKEGMAWSVTNTFSF